ncbi:MAG: 3-phosphoshikimate 1-carboxyvinyltransferase [Clostridia bacterium]
MEMNIGRSALKGTVLSQPSKSEAHRILLCAGLAKGTSHVDNLVLSEDVLATLEALKTFSGYELEDSSMGKGRHRARIFGRMDRGGQREIDCGESGTTLRFLSLICAGLGGRTVFTGKGRLPQRPMEESFQIYGRDGIRYRHGEAFLPLRIEGKLKGGEYMVRGNVSSQFVSGLLMGLALVERGGHVGILGELESAGYVDLTMDVMECFNVRVEKDQGYTVPGSSTYLAAEKVVSGDWSNAAFFHVMNALGADIGIQGLEEDSSQPDRVIRELLEKTGDKVIDVSQCPDLVPALCTWGAAVNGTLRITNARRLKLKESDRLLAMAVNLNKIGARAMRFDDGLFIEGGTKFKGGTVESFNDHRIAMAFASLAPVIGDRITIRGAECVKKSYPGFFEDFARLGGNIL